MFDFNRIHFIGIGGISMSALAMLTSEAGVWVSGSDRCDSEIIQKLKDNGINAYVGSNNSVVSGSDLVVYTSAVGGEDKELKFARANKIRCMERKAYLALMSKTCKSVIAVAGSHGKTSVSAMLCHIFDSMALPFKGHVGGIIKSVGKNYIDTGNDYFVTEACEYGRSFLSLEPDIGVILNCDYDHPDTYPTKENMYEAFVKFAEQSKIVVIGEDAYNTLDLRGVDRDKVYTFGFGEQAYFRAVNIKNVDGKFSFDALCDNKSIGKFALDIYGRHNVLNALAVIAVCHLNWLDMMEVSQYISDFDGVDRRFTDCGYTPSGARVIVDYAHHPKEISATIDTVRLMTKGRIIAVFEPHTYSRTKALLEEFADSFYWVDDLIILPTYGARESEEEGIGGDKLAKYINKNGEGTLYLPSYESAREYIQSNTTAKDIVVVLGAGSVNALGLMLTE
ncbi:MAG: UDP-N-acetylmuramate--L-alanine ligase [Clostridia bacterium]|nr:UDP-N-acetylmuramate--L-alanine ligase [Clostridia bacterium]